MMLKSTILTAMLLATAAAAQEPPPVEVDIVGGGVKSAITIAVPAMPSAGGGPTDSAARSPRSSRPTCARPACSRRSARVASAATAMPRRRPAYAEWRGAGASALVSGFVEQRGDGRLTVGCYVHDVTAGRPLANQGFTVAPADWRRAAHKCADIVYSRLSGEGAFLDTRVVYVAETGPKTRRMKRIAIMDSDGSNHRYLTAGRRP